MISSRFIKSILSKDYFYSFIADEINTIARYSDDLYYLNQRKDHSYLFSRLECLDKSQISYDEIHKVKSCSKKSTVVVLNGTLNYQMDIQELLKSLYPVSKRDSRVVTVLYNPIWSFLFKFIANLGFIKGSAPETFLTNEDLDDLCKLTGFEVVRIRPCCFIPFRLFGASTYLNKFLTSIPLIRKFALTYVIVIRPKIPISHSDLKLSVVIPARNESGNIENAIKRLPLFTYPYELIFIEGGSTDDTWLEIQRVQEKYRQQLEIKIVQQNGKGKANAVETGIGLASGNLIAILDADLTMPPEALTKFVDAYAEGHGDFINGSRLLYPMEKMAMRFLNKIGNYFFATMLSFVLETRLTDSLCGTKLFARSDYLRFMRWKNDFKSNDPFGDFDLLFPACTLGLGVVNLPIRYADRTYGTTNISRFTHGFMLLKMTLVGFFKVRMRFY